MVIKIWKMSYFCWSKKNENIRKVWLANGSFKRQWKIKMTFSIWLLQNVVRIWRNFPRICMNFHYGSLLSVHLFDSSRLHVNGIVDISRVFRCCAKSIEKNKHRLLWLLGDVLESVCLTNWGIVHRIEYSSKCCYGDLLTRVSPSTNIHLTNWPN